MTFLPKIACHLIINKHKFQVCVGNFLLIDLAGWSRIITVNFFTVYILNSLSRGAYIFSYFIAIFGPTSNLTCGILITR